MNRLCLFVLVITFGSAEAAPREVSPREINDHHWVDVERIVAIGDLHGDYDNYIKAMRAAGLVDRRDRWIAGQTHLVQTGDIPDRGPDTRKIIQHMARLERQARRKGGRVHNLIGNHEAMNVYGDLRYVTDEEFEAFATPRSERIRDRYFEAVLDDMKKRDPEGFADLPDNFREQWDARRPLGWVEHRQAWNPNWDPDGEMFEWVSNARVAVQINDVIFVHGGISGHYCRDALQSMTEHAHAALKESDPDNLGILTDENGPLWYRGLAGVAPEAPSETVEAILDRHDARHIVIGHTPTGGIIWPRYSGRVIQIDTGISAAYGGHVAYLEITPQGLSAGYLAEKIELPGDADNLPGYLEQVLELLPDNNAAREKLQMLRDQAHAAGRAEPEKDPATEATDAATADSGHAESRNQMPICGTRL